MKKTTLLFLFFCLFSSIFAQNTYFPPITGNTWETTTPKSLGWCEDKIDSLYLFLEQKNTKAFLVLKDGRIVLEKYFGTFKQDSVWYWASAGKSLTGFMVGLAQQDGKLNINDKISKYLGVGWSGETAAQEDKITVLNQLTMTTGFDDGVANNNCTLPSCLLYKADANARWAYHNAPYTLLDKVIEKATGVTLNSYISTRLKVQTGIVGNFYPLNDANVFFSTPRSMARFGLLVLNKGKWNNTTIMSDQTFYKAMTNTSQNLNKSYGYLWWLNGKTSYMLPTLQTVFPGKLTPNAPDDMFSAMGKNGQLLHIVPSQNLVVIRMGNSDGSPVPTTFANEIWKNLNKVICKKTANEDLALSNNWSVFPNPTNDFLYFPDEKNYDVTLFDASGKVVFKQKNISNSLNISNLKNACYFGVAKNGGEMKRFKFVKF